MEQCHRPWWKRPPFWFLVIAAVIALFIVYFPETGGKPTPTPYGKFLDQIEAGNVASVTFQGTEIHGRYKHSLDSTPASGKVPPDTFSSRVPDVGDPTLMPALRKQRVAIDVNPPSQWAALFARIPWPMLVFLGAVMIAALVRLLRGGKAQSGPAVPTLPGHGMIGLVSGLFAKQHQAERPPAHDGDEPKSG
jgi:ATP-dependent Zn protease